MYYDFLGFSLNAEALEMTILLATHLPIHNSYILCSYALPKKWEHSTAIRFWIDLKLD